MEATPIIGWLSAAVLFATIAAQITRQLRTGQAAGVSPLLYVGQITASGGFAAYAALTGDVIFVVTNAALAAVARAVGTVQGFVHDNRKALVDDVERLTRVVKTIGSEKTSIDTALRVAPTAIGNLALAFNNRTGTIGSRIGISGNVWDADGFLCAVVQQSGLPRASADLACKLFKQLLEPVEGQVPTIPPGSNGRAAPSAGTSGLNRVQQYAADGPGSLGELMGGPS